MLHTNESLNFRIQVLILLWRQFFWLKSLFNQVHLPYTYFFSHFQYKFWQKFNSNQQQF